MIPRVSHARARGRAWHAIMFECALIISKTKSSHTRREGRSGLSRGGVRTRRRARAHVGQLRLLQTESMEPGSDYPISWGGSPATPGMTTEEQYIFDLSGVRAPDTTRTAQSIA